MTKPIVVGLDGSRESLAAADWGARAALLRGAPLRLVHAWEGPPSADFADARRPDLTVPQFWARRVLRGAVDRIGERHPQLYMSAEQVRLPPRQALLAEADSAELLVLGHDGAGGPGGLLSGSVALSVVARATVPVVLVRASFTAADEHRQPDDTPGGPLPGHDLPYRDVVVAVDPARPCEGHLRFAFEEAARRNATVDAVHIWHLPYETAPAPLPGAHARAAQAAEHALERRLAPWREKFPTVRVRSAAVHARTAHEIVHAAHGAGLLVVGRRPRRAGVGPHTGPVTHAVLHHVACPVVVVPHE
ncbi:universal stress protein [Streptomyces sp. VRA16 Mangrove soil]|uniref:universal stress protein n=1 Tax=Streptomyces sp. VRA16 Mangrove soil TaxID=2817434 RepID=UPI001A9E0454|nr:universal stress protein [Streptomyces sp. VRA16 Mangrove soil]MBO1333029.1 universal stress protein [Streptomyces sp. VRA16 Mangrove soil]